MVSANGGRTEYVDAEMARMRLKRQQEANAQSLALADAQAQSPSHHGVKVQLPHRLPASIGQIQEVDLGPSAAARNIAMTEAATRRLGGQSTTEDDVRKAPQRIRLGRDGKPRPPPRRKRRGSEDLKRDEIVDALLRESKLDIYEPPAASSHPEASASTSTATGHDTAADDALAEQFQREFLEAMQSRREIRNKPPPGPTTGAPGAAKTSEIARGPKLGGSRSARAAMHAAEKEKEKARGKGVVPGGSKR